MSQNNGASGGDGIMRVYEQLLEPTERDNLLEEANLRLGNYNETDRYQQLEGYRRHLYGEAAFGRGKNVDRAKSDIKHELALEWWEDKITPEEREDLLEQANGRRRRLLKRKGEQLWRKLLPSEEEVDDLVAGTGGDPNDPELREYFRNVKILQLLEERSNIDGELMTAFARMMLARHESSASKGAHLIDAVTGRVRTKEFKGRKPPKGRLGKAKRRVKND